MNKNLITFYFKKTFLGKLSYSYKYLIKKNNYLEILYFYWLFCKIYERKTNGLCGKKKKNKYANMESFFLYFNFKDIKINQLYFKTSPFNLLIKKKKQNTLKFKRIYII